MNAVAGQSFARVIECREGVLRRPVRGAVAEAAAVGKISKPALKNREIEDALGDALRNAGLLIRSINACSDPSYGTTVQVSVGGGSDAELARQVLGQFPFRFQLSDAALSRPL